MRVETPIAVAPLNPEGADASGDARAIPRRDTTGDARARRHTVDTTADLMRQLGPSNLRALQEHLVAPLVRHEVRRTLQEMTQRAAETRPHTVTWHGLRWLVDAWRTGRSVQEVVLEHALVYRVEQVFLIHQETGLLLAHAERAEGGPPVKEPEMVSGMLVAIQEFVRDAFTTRDDDALDSLRVGEFTLYVERGSVVSLTAAVVGVAPEAEIRRALHAALREVEQTFGEALDRFRGDSSPFADARPLLAACLLAAE